MASRIQIRRGFSYNWEAVNPILAQGEMGYELDTGKMKIGDGETAWNPLQYFGGAAGNGFSGKYEDLIGVPTLLSGFNNDVGFITAASVPSDIKDLTDNTGLLTSSTGQITFDNTKIIGAAHGPGTFPSIELVPDAPSYANNQFITVDSGLQARVRLYSGSPKNNNSSIIQLGELRNYVSIGESTGVQILHTSEALRTLTFLTEVDFSLGQWESYEGGGSIKFTSSNIALVNSCYSFVNNGTNYLEIATGQGTQRITFNGFESTGPNEYQILVNRAPPDALPQTVLEISIGLVSPAVSQVSLEYNNLVAEIANDLRINSKGSFNLSTDSTTEPISITANRSSPDRKTWRFELDGSITFPDSTNQSTAVSNLSSLRDITISSPSTGQVLSFNGSTWTNSELIMPVSQLGDLSVVVTAAGTANLSYDSTTGVFEFTPPDLSSYLLSSVAEATYQEKNTNLTEISLVTDTDGLLKKTATGWELDKTSYLTSYTETDPIFAASPASTITNTQIANWQTTHSWGDHAAAGYFLPVINAVTGTTNNIGNNASDSLDLISGQAYILYKIQTSAAAWVRVYNSSSARLADADRSQGVDPGVSSGVIAEAITTGAETVVFAPAPNGFNNETPPTNVMPIAVTNLSGSNTSITVTITKLTLVG